MINLKVKFNIEKNELWNSTASVIHMLFINWNKSLADSIEYVFDKPGKEYKVSNYSELQEKKYYSSNLKCHAVRAVTHLKGHPMPN